MQRTLKPAPNLTIIIEKLALDPILQKPTLEELDDPPSINEVRNSIKQMNYGEAAGKDEIPTELYKALSME